MFYIRKDSGNKRRIENVSSLSKGFKKMREYNYPVALFYDYKGRGVKVYTSNNKSIYKLLVQDKQKQYEPKLLFETNSLLQLYIKFIDLNIEETFDGYIKLQDDVSEFFRLNGYNDYINILNTISKPLKSYLEELDSSSPIFINESNSYINDLTGDLTLNNVDLSKPKENIIYEDINLDDINNFSFSYEETDVDMSENENNIDLSQNRPEYNVVGVLTSGSLVHLSKKSPTYKDALEKYQHIKATQQANYKEIRLNSYSGDGEITARYKKKLEKATLSYDSILEFVQDLVQRISYVNVLKEDILNAMAVEDKKCNLGYHILEASDFDLDNELFVNNLIQMKVSGDRRRDLKKCTSLINLLSEYLVVPGDFEEKIENQIVNIDELSQKGIDTYKNQDVHSFIKEYDETEVLLNPGAFRKKRLTMRPCVSEGKVVVYKKSHL